MRSLDRVSWNTCNRNKSAGVEYGFIWRRRRWCGQFKTTISKGQHLTIRRPTEEDVLRAKQAKILVSELARNGRLSGSRHFPEEELVIPAIRDQGILHRRPGHLS